MGPLTRNSCSSFFKAHPELKVVFKKKNGELRTMICTTKIEHIPKQFHPKGTSTRPVSEEDFNVIDLEANGWRSFRFDSVISIEVDDDE